MNNVNKHLTSVLLAIIVISSIFSFPTDIFGKTLDNNYMRGYYYLKLNDTEKSAYDKIVEGVSDHQDSIPVPELNSDSKRHVVRAIRNDHPEFYNIIYSDPAIEFFKLPVSGMYYATSYNDNDGKNNEVTKAKNEFLADAPRTGTDYEKVLFVHDKLVKDVDYSITGNTIYDILINHHGSSVAYALTMKYLLSALGVKSYVIEGQIVGDSFRLSNKYFYHMLNVVTINGNNCLIDVQRDEPIDLTEDSSVYNGTNYISHRYFNFSKETIKDFIPYDNDDWSDCNDQDASASYYKNSGLYFSTYEDSKPHLTNIIKNNLLHNKNYIELQYGSELETKKALSALIIQDEFNSYLIEARALSNQVYGKMMYGSDKLVSQNVLYIGFPYTGGVTVTVDDNGVEQK